MIIGIGTDLCDIRRIERTLERFGDRFCGRVFTPRECERAFGRAHPAAALAQRYAAKEAASKALGTGFRQGVFWRDLVVDNKPLEAQFLSLLGDTYNAVKDFAQSDEAYGKALAINSDDAGVLNNWAYYLSERGEKLEKAEEMSRRSNELAPGTATYMDTYAWILYKEGKYEMAREWQEKAIAASDAPEGVLLEHYGDILFKLGDSAGALEQWKQAQAAGDASELIDRKVSEGILVE